MRGSTRLMVDGGKGPVLISTEGRFGLSRDNGCMILTVTSRRINVSVRHIHPCRRTATGGVFSGRVRGTVSRLYKRRGSQVFARL